MENFDKAVRSITQQTAAMIRHKIRSGLWREFLPGRVEIAKELGVSIATVSRACAVLIQEGILEDAGDRKRRRILSADVVRNASKFKVCLILWSASSRADGCIVAILSRLEKMGVAATIIPQIFDSPQMDLKRIKQIVRERGADAWIIQGANKEIAAWFSTQKTPVFALGGGIMGIRITGAGFDSTMALATITRRLIEVGHRRIVYLEEPMRLASVDCGPIQAFCKELEAAGITVGSYHHPLWDGTPSGLDTCLKMTFKLTPPTALILGNMRIYVRTKNFLTKLGKKIPQDLSLCVNDCGPGLDWDTPLPAYVYADPMDLVAPVVEWLERLIMGNVQHYQIVLQRKFHEGETIGPPPKNGSKLR